MGDTEINKVLSSTLNLIDAVRRVVSYPGCVSMGNGSYEGTRMNKRGQREKKCKMLYEHQMLQCCKNQMLGTCLLYYNIVSDSQREQKDFIHS